MAKKTILITGADSEIVFLAPFKTLASKPSTSIFIAVILLSFLSIQNLSKITSESSCIIYLLEAILKPAIL